MTRATAKTTFLVAYTCGFVVALLVRVLDPADAIRIPLFVAYVGVLVGSGLAWLVLAMREGAIAAALPEYLGAAAGLAVIAGASALVTVVGLVLLGESIDADSVSSGAFVGTGAVLLAYWGVQIHRRRT
jgi:hypothetical protein